MCTMKSLCDVNQLICALSPLMQTVAATFGHNCEVVIHDLTQPESSVIAIVNGHVTGRKVGDPITDFGLSMLRDRDHGDDPVTYSNRTRDGRILRCSSTFIRDERGKVIGAVCVNFDITDLVSAKCALDPLTSFCEERSERYYSDVEGLVNSLLDEAQSHFGKPLSLMKRADRLRVIEDLDAKGCFVIRGAVPVVANRLRVSRMTVYNYLAEVRAANDREPGPEM